MKLQLRLTLSLFEDKWGTRYNQRGTAPISNPSSSAFLQAALRRKIRRLTFPTSLGVLAGYLLGKGVGPIQIVDEQVGIISSKELPELIRSLQHPKVVGMSVLTINSRSAYDLSEKIKSIGPEVFVVFGGIHPTVLPEEALGHESVDLVVRGEGEETLTELVELLSERKDYGDIRGISFRKNGEIIHTPDRPLISNLDEIPPFPYHMFEEFLDEYPTFGSVFTSRGCPYKCIFCSSRSVSGRRYRYFSIERVISDIKILADKYNQKTIWLMDDNIAANSKHFMALLDAIIKEGLHKRVEFHGSMRGDNVREDILDRAKAANFRMLAYGLETGSERLMKLIDKGG